MRVPRLCRLEIKFASTCISKGPAMSSARALFFLAPFAAALAASASHAAPTNCPLDHGRLVELLRKSVKASGGPTNGGFDNNEWSVIVGRDGVVCAVAFSGANWDAQWLGSRAIAAQKAFAANAFSLKEKALSTANLYSGAQPGGFLYGLLTGDPPVAEALYAGDASAFGQASDPLVGKRAGGVVAFGGGLALYDDSGLIGALGVSGDTSCADHNVAWRVRHEAGLDHVPAGPTEANDGIVYDIGLTGSSASGFGHPKCGGKEADVAKEIGAGK